MPTPYKPSPKELTEVPSGPWDRMEKESGRAYSALIRYLQLGPERTYAKMVKQYGYREQSLYSWAKTHRWKDRVAAYDEYMNREIMARLQNGLAEMCERHVAEAQMLQGKAIDKLRALSPSELTPSDVAKFIDTAIKIERQGRGVNDQPSINVTATANSGDMMKVLVNVVLETVEDPEVRHRIAEKLNAVINTKDGADGRDP